MTESKTNRVVLDVAKFDHTATREICAWCWENCSGLFFYYREFFYFELGEDAALFMLRWGESR